MNDSYSSDAPIPMDLMMQMAHQQAQSNKAAPPMLQSNAVAVEQMYAPIPMDLLMSMAHEQAMPNAAVAEQMHSSNVAYSTETLAEKARRYGFDITRTMDMPTEETDPPERKKRGARRNSVEQQAERMAMCLEWLWRRARTGINEVFSYKCQLKSCPYCGEQRGQKLCERIASTLGKDRQVGYVVAADESTARAIVALVPAGQKNYLRIPQQDGTEYIFIADPDLATTFPEAILLSTIADLATLNWTMIQNTADDRCASGKLGKKAAAPKDEADNSFIYNTPSYYVAPEHQALWQQIDEEVLIATFDMNPRTKEQFVYMMLKRDQMLREKATQNNITFTRLTTPIKVDLSYIDWHVSIYDRCEGWLLQGKLEIARWNAFWHSLTSDRQREIVEKSHQERLSRYTLSDL